MASRDAAYPGIIDFEETETGQQDAGNQHQKRADVERDANAHGVAVGPSPGITHVQHAEQDQRNGERKAEQQVHQEHNQVEIAL